MDIKHLQLLSDIVEAGSLSKVCASRGIAQSALSKHIASLETEFGAKVFYRTGRGVVLTEFGQSIMPRVRSLLHEFDQLKSEIRDRADVPSGPVRLAVQTSITHALVGPLFQTRADRVSKDRTEVDGGLLRQHRGCVGQWASGCRRLRRYGGRITRWTKS